MSQLMHERTGFYLPATTIRPPRTQAHHRLLATDCGKARDSAGLAGGNRKVRVTDKGIGHIRRVRDLYREREVVHLMYTERPVQVEVRDCVADANAHVWLGTSCSSIGQSVRCGGSERNGGSGLHGAR